MPDETLPCLCEHLEEEHDPTDGLSFTLPPSEWEWVEASRCRRCPCMRFREQVPA